MQIAYEKPNVKLGWDEDLACGYIEWKGVGYGQELRGAMERFLLLMKERNGHKELVNLEKCRIVSQEDQEWIAINWLPRATAAGLKYAAFIVPRSEKGKESLDNTVPYADPEQKLAYFDNLEEARAWLRNLK